MLKQFKQATKKQYLRNMSPAWFKLACFLFVIVATVSITRTLTPVFQSPTAHAAASTTLNFQARLYNSSGAVVPDGSYSIAFNLYEDLTGGASLWNETQASVSVKNGYFSVELGSSNAFPGTITWDDDKFLTMNVNADGEMTPRIKLTATPYAFQSERAKTLQISNGGFTSTLSLTAPTANRTLTAPNLSGTLALTSNNQTFSNTQTFSGTLAVSGTTSITGTNTTIGNAITDNFTIGAAIQGLNALVFDGATNDGLETVLAVADPTQDNTVTLPNASGTICLDSGNCAGSGGNGDILQGGNSFSADMTIGTNDAFALNLETAGTTRFSISSTGVFTFVGLNCTTFANGGALTTDASGNLSCSNDDGGGSTGVSSLNTLTGSLVIQGTTGKVSVADNTTDTITIDLDASVSLLGQSIQDGEVDDDLTISAAGSVADGALSAAVSLLGQTIELAELAADSVNSAKIVDGSVTGSDISAGTVTGGNILNGTIEATDLETTNAAGAGTNGYTLIYDNTTGGFTYVDPASLNTGGVDSLNSLTGALSLQGTSGQIAVTDDGGSTITLALNANVSLLGQTIELAELSADSVNASKIVDGSVSNADLANSSITVSSGNGLTGCGAVSLGGSCTLAVGAGTGISVTVDAVGLSYAATLAGNPTLAANLSTFASTGLIFEGSTADTNELLFTVANPSVDRTITLPDATGTVITTGNLSNITATGTITSGTWQGGVIADAYINDSITVNWTGLQNYPTGCSAGQAVTAVGDTLTCGTFATTDTNTTYSAGDGLSLTGTTFAVDSTVCRTSGNCAGTGGNGDILQGGNSFGATMTIGTNDAHSLVLETGGIAALTINNVGAATFSDTVTADAFAGIGADLTALNASNISTGTLADARLSTNVSLLGQTIESAEITNGTVQGLDLVNNTITDTQLAFDTGQHLTTSSSPQFSNLTLSGGTVSLTNATSNAINYGTAGVALPSDTSAGWKLKLYDGGAAGGDYGFGIAGSELWQASNGEISFYTGGAYTKRVNIDATGTMDLITGALEVGGTSVLTSGRVLQNVTYNGNSIADAYIDNNITVDWTGLQNYPTGCSAGQAVTTIGDTLTCATFATTDTNTTYSAGNDLDLSGTTFNLEPQLDFVTTINRTSSNLTLQTTTSGNIILNAAGTIELQDNTNVTGDLSVTGNGSFAGRQLTLSNLYPEYRWRFGGGTDLNWKTIANINLGTGLYVGASYQVDILDANTNFGAGSNGAPMRFYVSALRSSGVQDDGDTGSVSGPSTDYVRLVKTALGVYELQVRQTVNYKHLDVNARLISTNGSTTLSYVDNPTNGSTTGTIYTSSTTGYTQEFPNIDVNGNFSQTGAGSFSTGTGGNTLNGTTSLTGATTISAASGTGLNFSNIGLITDINLQNGETIDNDVDGTIRLTATNTNITGALQTNGTTRITSTGIIQNATYNGNSIADAYIDNNITVDWTGLQNYPTGCAAGQAVTTIGDTLTCGTFATTDTNTTYSAGNDLDLSGTTFNLEPQLDFVTTINRTSSNLTLQTTTSGNILLNAAGTIELQDNTNVTGNLDVSGSITAGSSNQFVIASTGVLTATTAVTSGTGYSLDVTNAAVNGALIDIQSASASQYALRVTSNNGAIIGLSVKGDGTVDINNLNVTGSCTGCGAGGANTSLSNLTTTSINQSLLPAADDTYDLGSSTARWQDLYLGPNSLYIGTNGNDAAIRYNTGAGYLAFDPNNDATNDVVITDTGYLGVGTVSPAGTLAVQGDAAVPQLKITNSNTTSYLDMIVNTSGQVNLNTDTTKMIFHGVSQNASFTKKSAWNLPATELDSAPAFADLDNDGDTDALVPASQATNNTVNFESNTKWDQSSFADYSVYSMVYGDLNGDGLVDRITQWYTGSAAAASYHTSRGGETTHKQVDWLSQSLPSGLPTSSSACAALVDIDNDGDLDYYLGGSTSSAYQNTGTATSPSFAANATWNLPDLGNYNCAKFADIDNDGDYDALVGDNFNTETDHPILYGVENTGTASSPTWTANAAWNYNAPASNQNLAPGVADIDNDGDYDFLYVVNNGIVYGVENTGTASSPTWTANAAWNFSASGSRMDIITVPDADGVPAGIYGTVGTGTANGSTGWADYFDVGLRGYRNTGSDLNPVWTMENTWDLTLNWQNSDKAHPALVQLDNDGDYDLLVGKQDGVSYAYSNTGTTSNPAWTAQSGWNVPDVGDRAAPAAARLDDDNDYDLVVGAADGISYAFNNSGSVSAPTWSRASAWDAPDTGVNASPALADLDNDGDNDLVLGDSTNQIQGFKNIGTTASPTWQANTAWNLTVSITNQTITNTSPAFADFGTDGDYDIIAGTDNGASYGYENTASADDRTRLQIDSTGIYTDQSITVGVPADLAEAYPSGEPLEAGDVVVFGESLKLYKSREGYQKGLAGIVSSAPGFLLAGDTGDTPLALKGRVPTKVTDENGAIEIGDHLTSSATMPGHAMKATGVGPVIGVAIESFGTPENQDTLEQIGLGGSDSTSTETAQNADDTSDPVVKTGKIEVFVGTSYYNPVGGNLQGGTMEVAELVTTGSVTVGENLNVGGNVHIKGSLTVEGNFEVKGTIAVTGDANFAGNVTIDGMLYSTGQIPVVATGVASGIEGEVVVDGTNSAGTIIIKPIAGMTSEGLPEQLQPGQVAEVSFTAAFKHMPRMQLTPVNEDAVNVKYYITRDENGFKLVITEPLASGKVYSFDYFVIGAEGRSAVQATAGE